MINQPLKYLSIILFSSIFIACDGQLLNDAGHYPLELNPLSEEALKERADEFHDLSGGKICSELDKYGYTIGKGCMGTDRPEQSIDSTKAIDMARSELTDYSKFTNVSEESDLKVTDAHPMPRSDNREWKVTIDQQIIQNIPVKNSKIRVWLTADGVYRIDGYWYPKVIIPNQFEVEKQEALQNVIGHTISYSDWTGSKTFTVEESSLPPASSVEAVILPFHEEDKLQLRVAWEIPVPANNPMWNLYLDVMDKQLLQNEPLIMF